MMALSSVKELIAVVMLLLLFNLNGCTSEIRPYSDKCTLVIKPRRVKPILVEQTRNPTGSYSVMIDNDQYDNTEQLIAESISYYEEYDYFKKKSVPKYFHNKLCVNYNEWTEFFVSSWIREMSLRGIPVDKESPNRISVQLWGFEHGDDPASVFRIQAHAKISLSRTDNTWEKTIEGMGYSRWTVSGAYENLVKEVVQALMRDPEVLAQMKHVPADR